MGLVFQTSHPCAPKNAYRHLADGQTPAHTRKTISTIAVSYTNSRSHLEEVPLDQPGLLRYLLYEKAMVALGSCLRAQQRVQAGGRGAWSQPSCLSAGPQPRRPSPAGEVWTSSSNLGENPSLEMRAFSCPLVKGMKSLWCWNQQNCL